MASARTFLTFALCPLPFSRRVDPMRRSLALIALAVVAIPRRSTSGKPAAQARPAPATPASMLTVDSIMRGPKLVGRRRAPCAGRGIRRRSTSPGRKPATSARPPTSSIATAPDSRRCQPKRRARSTSRRRAASIARAGACSLAEGGDIVIYDVDERRAPAAHAHVRRRDESAMGSQRHGGHVHARRQSVSRWPSKARATCRCCSSRTSSCRKPAAAGGQRAAGAGGAGAGGRAVARARGRHRRDSTDTEAQRFLREQERSLIDFIRRQSEQQQDAGGRGGRGGRGGAADAPAASCADSARFDADVASDARRRAALRRRALRLDRRHRTARRRRRADRTRPNYVTESSYPEMIRRPHERRRRRSRGGCSRCSIARKARRSGPTARRLPASSARPSQPIPTRRACSTGACRICPTTARRA